LVEFDGRLSSKALAQILRNVPVQKGSSRPEKTFFSIFFVSRRIDAPSPRLGYTATFWKLAELGQKSQKNADVETPSRTGFVTNVRTNSPCGVSVLML
jgi:hypothetical protein